MILQDIKTVFPEVNWKALNYTNYPRIRFYFDDTQRDLLEVQKLSTAIVDDIFDGDPIFIATTFFLQYTGVDKNTLTAIRERGLIGILNTNESECIEIEEEIWWHYFFSQIQASDIEKINKAIIEADFALDPLLQLHCYYFCLEKHLMINLYDNRGMDVISNDIHLLEKIRTRWRDKVTITF